MVCCNEENISLLLAGFQNNTDSLICCSAALDRSLVHTGMAYHVWRCEVVHQEFELAILDPLSQFVTDWTRAHLGVLVVGGNLGASNQFTLLSLKLFLDASIEEECDVGVLLGFSDMALLEALLAKPLGQNVVHDLGLKSHGEAEVRLVSRHGGNLNVLGIGEVGPGRAILVAEKLRDFADTVGSVVEEEERVVICTS